MSKEPLLKVCLGCGQCTEKMDKCKICKDEFKIKSYYCTKECQKKDWTRHKALHKASGKGETRESAPLVEVPQDYDENGMTQLMKLCYDGDWKAVQKLLNAGADPSQVDWQGLTALNYAISANRVKVVQVLCSMAPRSLILRGPAAWKSSSCLFQAAYKGNLDILKSLVEAAGQDALFKPDSDGRTCLHAACKHGRIELVRYLLEVGGIPLLFCKDVDQRTCLFAACEDNRADVVARLLESGGDKLLEIRDFQRNSCIMYLCQRGHLQSLRATIKAVGAARFIEIQLGDVHGALFDAFARNNTPVADILLALPGAGALVRRRATESSCLYAAADIGNVAALRTILRLGGADELFEKEPTIGYTCLHVAASRGRAEAAALLAEAGGERLVLMPDAHGDTCLHVAAYYGHLAAVRVLARAGGAALARSRNQHDALPLHVSAARRCPTGGGAADAEAIAEVLLAAGGAEQLARPDCNGSLPVHIACTFGSVGTLRAIARAGGPDALHARSARGHTPLDVAVAAKHHDAVRALLQLGAA
jgi:ankyrin repeat protein